jgi:multidrug efflux pump subunit AcrA (membrane-fusion protein)
MKKLRNELSDKLNYEESSFFSRYVIYVFIFFIVSTLYAATHLEIDDIIKANGSITSATNLKIINCSQSSNIKKIFVKEGDIVHKGDKVVLLEDTNHKITINKLKIQIRLTKNIYQRTYEEYNNKVKLFKDGVYSQSNINSIKDKLDSLSISLEEYKEKLKQYKNDIKKYIVTSPYDGIVTEMFINSIGMKIRSSEKLMSILPLHEELICELFVDPMDIGFVEREQTVNIKVSAYKYSRYGFLNGKITYISSSTVLYENKMMYKIKVKLTTQYMPNKKEALLKSGMIVSSSIIVDHLSLITYLLSPIRKFTGHDI